jgi:predicted  nucleic acid-binding Zn-ribbon protein
MWKNLGANVTGMVGAALENVQKIGSDLEAQLDAAVAEDENGNVIKSSPKYTPSKSQSNIDLSSAEDVAIETVNKTNSEGALSSLSTAQLTPSKTTKNKKTKGKKKSTPGKLEKSSNSEEDTKTPEPNTEDMLNFELQQSREEERIAVLLIEQERLLKVKHDEEEAAAQSKKVEAKAEARAKAEVLRQEKLRKAEEDAEQERIRQAAEEAELQQAKEEAARAKATKKAEQKKAREEAKLKKAAEAAKMKAEEEAQAEAYREERKREAAEKKKLSEEKTAADEEARLELKKSQELARQLALQEAKEAAALKKQAEDAKKELIKQQVANDSVSLQHTLEIEKFEALVAEHEIKQIELEHKNSELTSLLEDSAHESQTKMSQLSASFKLEEEEWKVNMNEALDRSKKEMESRAAEECSALTALVDEHREKIESLEDENVSIKDQLATQEMNFSNATKKVTEQLQFELDKMSEVVSDRERALQTSTMQMSELTTSYEDALSKISHLEQAVGEYQGQLRQSSAASASTSDLRKQLSKVQESLQEKEDSLAAFLIEGQGLAKKQSDMEKNVRKSRLEVKEKDAEIKKLKETKEEYVKTIEEMQEVIRANENNSNSTKKNMSGTIWFVLYIIYIMLVRASGINIFICTTFYPPVMQAVSQASQDKLLKLETELAGKADELAIQRKALESSWTEISDLKKIISELKAEKDDLQNQIGAGANKVVATESTRRDLEQREAILRATNKQLQDSLQRQMSESVAREERMREELNDTRKRWQEAVSSRESLASEVSGATTPLLRQVSSLQENLRVKSEGWQKVMGVNIMLY